MNTGKKMYDRTRNRVIEINAIDPLYPGYAGESEK